MYAALIGRTKTADGGQKLSPTPPDLADEASPEPEADVQPTNKPTRTPKPEPQPEPTHTVSKQGVFTHTSLTGKGILENYVRFSFNSQGGPVTGNGYIHKSEVSPEYSWCPAWDTASTLTFKGEYTPKSHSMHGTYTATGQVQTYGGADCTPWTMPADYTGTFEATEKADGSFEGILYTKEVEDIRFELTAK